MDGVLLRILKRMHGLQSVALDLSDDLGRYFLSDDHLTNKEECQAPSARDLLLLVREELSHIKKITMEWSGILVEDELAFLLGWRLN